MKTGLFARISLAAAAVLLTLGCSTSGSPGAPSSNPVTGQHPATWVDTHWQVWNQNKAQCSACHGSYTDATQSGGTSGVSCFQCHHPSGPSHPVGWDLPVNHGASAKGAFSLTAGFGHCAACHGTVYNNADNTTVSCMTCHTKAPHPDAPWHGTTASGTNHTTVDPSNVSECAKCHLGGTNAPDITLLNPAPAGTAPGCFNNTLCHGNFTGHGPTWPDPAQHGLLGAMAAPSATTGFLACQSCHGTTFTGPARSCFSCHTKAPHPDAPWSGGPVVSHIFTDQGNVAVCAVCHLNGANLKDLSAPPAPPQGTAPGCFNNTLCHSKNIP